MTEAEIGALYEASKLDTPFIVGSEVRALIGDLRRERARAEAAEAALREVLDLFQPTAADEGWSGYLDRLGMEFYRETHVWPHFKSAPLEMHHDLADEDRQKRWTEWLTAKRDDACTRARALLGPGPSPSSGTGDAGTEGS